MADPRKHASFKTSLTGSSKLFQFMGNQQESRGVSVGVQAAEGVVANGEEVTVDNSSVVAVGGKKEVLATPENWVVARVSLRSSGL